MSKTIIFHCGHIFHIESSADDGYINALKEDHNYKQAFVVCNADDGTVLEKYGDNHYVDQCKNMITTIQKKWKWEIKIGSIYK